MNKIKSIHFRLILAILAYCIATFASSMISFAAPAQHTNFTYTGTKCWQWYLGNIYRDSDGQVAYCVDQMKGDPHGSYAFSSYLDKSNPLNYVLYHGYPRTNTIGGVTFPNDKAQAATVLAVWMIQGTTGYDGSYVSKSTGHHTNWKNPNGAFGSNLQNQATEIVNAASRLASDANNNRGTVPVCAALYTPADSSMQRVIIFMIANGSLDLQKSSDNGTATNGNSEYSLAGATYGLWDNNLNPTGHSFVTNGSGYAKVSDLDPGWYWVHETKAPKGYQLDTTHGQAGSGVGYNDSGWYHVEVVAGENRRINTNNVYDTPRIGKITVQKKDLITDSAVSKAGFKFRLLASDKTTVVRSEQTSDDNGQVTFENLGFGTYYVQETAAVSPFALNNEPVAVSVSDDGATDVKTFVASVADKMCYGNAEIKKIDNVKSSLVPGVGYDVVAQEDIDHPDGTVMYHKGEVVQHLVTGNDGTVTTKDGESDNRLYIGADGDGRYAFVETSVPAPLTIDRTPIPFTIAYAGDHAEKIETVHAAQVNNVAYGAASIHKTDNVLGEAIPNTTYDVKATEDITLWNGTVIYHEGEKVDSLITDENGNATTTTRLYVGTDGTGEYALTETSVSTGATIKTDPIPFTITYQNETVDVLGTAELQQVNNIVYGSAKITKTDSVINSNVPYAEFDVIAAEDITLWNGHKIYKKNQIIEHVITGQDGVARTNARYYVGSDGDGQYKFVETAVRTPLLLDTTPIPFTITYKDAATENVGCVAKGQKNNIPYAPASLTKTDNVLNSGVPGVEYDVRAAEDISLWNGSIYRKGQVIDHVITDVNGEANSTAKYYPGITGIGRYEFVETKVPTGLTIDTTPIPFTVKYKNQTDSELAKPHVTQTNNVVYGAASIKKTETTNGTNISGAEFDVVAVENVVLWNNNIIYKKGDVVEHVKTNADGIAKTTKPLYVGSNGKGEYKFVETFTPCPYYNDRIDVPFTINYLDNKTENVKIEESAQKSKGNEVQSRPISFKKTDFSNDAPVEGAVFELSPNSDIRTQSGSVIYKKNQVIGTYTTDKNGNFNVHQKTVKIDASGSCSYKFVEIKAPKGYVIDSTPANFTIKYAGQNVEVQSDMSVSIKNRPNTFKLSKSVLLKDGAGVTDTTVQNATFRLWNKSDELSVPLTDGTDSYALRIDNGNTSHDVTVAMASDTAQARLSDDTLNAHSIVLTDEQGNTYKINSAGDTDIPATRYTISVVGADGAKVASFNGDKHIDLRSGKRATYTITKDNDSDKITVSTKTETSNAVAAAVTKENGAYIATGLKLGTVYQVEVDGNVVYTLTTSDKGGKVYYGRYSTTADVYPYKRQPMLLTSDSKFIDKFTVNGKDYPVQTKIDTNGKISFSHIVPGSYGIGEVDVPILGDDLPESVESYLINTNVCYFDVDETTGRINGVNDFDTSFDDDYTVVTLSKVEVTGGTEIPGAKLEIQRPDGSVVDSWTSTDSPHVIERLAPGKYSMVEMMTPNRYDQATRIEFEVKDTGEVQHVEMVDKPIEINVQLDKRQEIAQPVVEATSPNGDGKNKADAQKNDSGHYKYSLDYRSTSNTWTDEFTVYDPLDCVNAGLARLDSIMTAQGFKDFDGKLNVWYQTNKTPADYADDKDKANATIDDGHSNPWIAGDTRGDDSKKNDPDGDGRTLDYTGWKLWAKDVSTTSVSNLSVSDLNLTDGEYVTAFRFEYGRVEEGFTTRTSAWDREDLKDQHDDQNNIEYIHQETFKESSFDKKSDISNALLSVLSSNASDDGDDDNTTDSTLLADKLNEVIDSNDEDSLNALIPSLKTAASARFESMLSSACEPDLSMEDVASIVKKSRSTFDGIASFVPSESKEIYKKFDDIINSIDDDDTVAIDKDAFENLSTLIDTSLEAIDVDDDMPTDTKYAPAVISMHVTNAYVPNANLDNSAYIDAYRNGGGNHLEGHDSDKVTQNTKADDVNSDVVALIQTGIDNIGYIVAFIIATIIAISLKRRI